MSSCFFYWFKIHQQPERTARGLDGFGEEHVKICLPPKKRFIGGLMRTALLVSQNGQNQRLCQRCLSGIGTPQGNGASKINER